MPQSREWLAGAGRPGLVSVIVPTWNRASLVAQALESVASQTYRPIELVVVDDGSTDGTREVVQAWIAARAADAGLAARCITQEHMGACAARNTGLEASHGEFVQFLDSDDLLHGERLERVVDVFRTTSCDYVYTGFAGFCGVCGRTVHVHTPRPAPWPPFEMLCRGDIWGNTLQITARRSVARLTGPWDASLAVAQDYDYLLRMLLTSDQGACIPAVLGYCRRGLPGRVSDVRFARVGLECQLHGAVLQCDGLVARESPPRIKAVAVRGLRFKAKAYRAEHPDISQSFADAARALARSERGSRARLEYACWRTLDTIWYAYRQTRRRLKMAALSVAGRAGGDHAATCAGPPEAGVPAEGGPAGNMLP